MLVRSGAIDVIVVDSVAALVPQAEIEGDMGDPHMGLQARLMCQALRKLTGTISKSQHDRHLHQPDPHEDRRDVRQPRDHHRRQRAQVLRLGAARHPPHRRDQARRRGHRQPHPREGREEQGGAAVPRGRVRHPLRRRHLEGGRARRPRRRARHHREDGRLVLVRRRAHRPGPRERARLPARAPGGGAPRSRRKVREKFGSKADAVGLPASDGDGQRSQCRGCDGRPRPLGRGRGGKD